MECIECFLSKCFSHSLNAAARTKNYSGAELEGVVKSAVSFALNRQISMDDLTKPLDEESIKVTMDDFLNALHEITPAFGASTDDLERCRYCEFLKKCTLDKKDEYILENNAITGLVIVYNLLSILMIPS